MASYCAAVKQGHESAATVLAATAPAVKKVVNERFMVICFCRVLWSVVRVRVLFVVAVPDPKNLCTTFSLTGVGGVQYCNDLFIFFGSRRESVEVSHFVL